MARVLFALPFGIFGLFHLMNGSQMSGMVPKFIPGGVFWVYLTGIALIAACVSMLIGKMGKLSTLLLSAMLAIFVLTIHLPAVIGGNMASMTNLLKDIALIGGALTYAGIFEKQEAGEKVGEKVTTG
ncbi:MAG: DoxX family protein [Methanobacteriota archaeon]|nr:MAG: DoxX family protein [Euryarchaeota archaeon]